MSTKNTEKKSWAKKHKRRVNIVKQRNRYGDRQGKFDLLMKGKLKLKKVRFAPIKKLEFPK